MDATESNRVAEFRQFKKRIRGSTEDLVVGLDIGKRKHHAFFGNGNGKTILKGLIVENSAEGFHHLLSQVDFYMQRDGFKSVAFGLEPTSVYHKPLAEHLIEQGHLVIYATNEAIKKNRSLIDGRWDKHDTKDSANVADLVAQGKCHYYDLPELRLRDLRSLLLLRKRLKKQEHSCRVRIRNNLVAQYFPELDGFWNHAAAENLAIVRGYLDPARIRQLSREEFIAKVATHNGGLRQQRRLREIWEAAGGSIGCRPGPAMQLEAELLVDTLQSIKQQLAHVEQAIQELATGFPEYGYLLSIPGFGPYVSAMTLAAIGNPHRFESRAQLIRLAGFDLCAHRSGEKSHTAVPVISKKGKADLRYALYQAALVASSLTRHFRSHYNRLLQGRQREKGIRTKMLVKIAAKMLVIAWTLMKRKEPFNPAYIQA
ncbi:MAG: IS110 family transposase [Deltaproteobacteria bacterium]|jgi:transposase|nr:MAG: IS110 family transposase [Deltaproteobacteria bacterium]